MGFVMLCEVFWVQLFGTSYNNLFPWGGKDEIKIPSNFMVFDCSARKDSIAGEKFRNFSKCAISIKLGRQRGFYSWTKIGAQRPAALLFLTISWIVSEVFVLAVSFPRNPVRRNNNMLGRFKVPDMRILATTLPIFQDVWFFFFQLREKWQRSPT